MDDLREYLENHLKTSELRELIDEILEVSTGETISTRTDPEAIQDYLESLPKTDLQDLIEYANDISTGESTSKSGSQPTLAARICENFTRSVIVESLNKLDLNGLPLNISKSGNRKALANRIVNEADEDIIRECLETLGMDDLEDEDDLEEDEDDYDDVIEDDDDDDLSPKRKRRDQSINTQSNIEPLAFDPKAKPKEKRAYQDLIISDLKSRYRADQSKERAYLYVATGGGKTLIANDFIMEEYILKGKRILWLTHSAPLLYQSAKDLCSRHGDKIPKIKDSLAYYGSENKEWILKKCLDSFKTRDFVRPPQVLYSTWQSLSNSLNDLRSKEGRRILDYRPHLVVIDEAHWGKGGTYEEHVYENLFDKHWANQSILGLSATPKVRSVNQWNPHHIGNISFPDLVAREYLSRPVPIRLDINSGAKIKFKPGTKLISNYEEIGRNKARNRSIIEHYQENRSKYGKTIFFACNIEHADLLGRELGGETAVVIHSKKNNPELYLEDFKTDKYNVAVVVGMAKEGIDIPNLRTVVLCKPVTSQIEFAQMIGRASRKTDLKSHFYIVDCFDTLEDKAIENTLYHFQDYFTGASDREEYQLNSPAPVKGGKRPVRESRNSHEFDPRVGLELITVGHGEEAAANPALALLNGLRINPRQTFGIELELSPESTDFDIDNEIDWLTQADILRNAVAQAVGDSRVEKLDFDAEANHEKWSIIHDGSCGWEIVSPILIGQAGFEEVIAVLAKIEDDEILKKAQMKVDYKTGFHVHLGWKYGEAKKVKKLLQFIRMVEPAIFSLVSPSRVIQSDGSPNGYCESIRSVFSDAKLRSLKDSDSLDRYFGDHEDRYRVINLTKYNMPISTAEIRLHNGTTNPAKVTLWISLWMNILSSIDNFDIPEINSFSCKPEIALPNGDEHSDIVFICHKFLGFQLKSCLPFLEKLHRRRVELFRGENWRKVLPGGSDPERIISDWSLRFEEISTKLG